MRTTVLLACALLLSSGAAFAAPKEVRGCVVLLDQADGKKCLALKVRDGEVFSLTGRNTARGLPPPNSGAIVAVTGRVTRGQCPLRVISNNIVVKSWTFTRVPCPLS